MTVNTDKKPNSTEIPPIVFPTNWRNCTIKECNEPLVSLSSTDKIVLSPEYSHQGYKHAEENIYVRLGVSLRLCKAAKLLPADKKFIVFDGWRPTALQEELFSELLERNRKKHAHLTEGELTEITKTYVTYPSDDPRSPNPHLTGGAIDLSICDTVGRVIPMGTSFDEFSGKSRTRYYEDVLRTKGQLTADEQLYLTNRRLLFNVLFTAGFTNYAEEWWHYDYGNQFWSSLTKQEAIYGAASRANV